MNNDEFYKLAEVHGITSKKTREACRLVMVDGLSMYAAGKKAGRTPSMVSRAIDKLNRPLCEKCGQPIEGDK